MCNLINTKKLTHKAEQLRRFLRHIVRLCTWQPGSEIWIGLRIEPGLRRDWCGRLWRGKHSFRYWRQSLVVATQRGATFNINLTLLRKAFRIEQHHNLMHNQLAVKRRGIASQHKMGELQENQEHMFQDAFQDGVPTTLLWSLVCFPSLFLFFTCKDI